MTKKKTAGKTAKKSKGRATWRTVTTRRGLAARSPEGRLYFGTSAEVRDAALMPWRRDMLAESLRIIRFYANHYECDREEIAEWAKSRRRDAIQAGSYDSTTGFNVNIPSDVYIRLRAGSRLVCDTFDEFLTDLWRAEIDALLDASEIDHGKREIPLTRHERAALDRLAARARRTA